MASTADRILALCNGADDILIKPLEMEEYLAKAQALLRRYTELNHLAERSYAMVFQNVYLFHDSIEVNIRMGKPEATQEEITTAAKTAACHGFIMTLPNGYQTVVGEGGSTLSSGEKQRISIARALLKAAPIILLDEATASLDPENEVLIQQAISALVQEKTVIVIAHRLQSICNADNIVVLKDGRVAESGGHETLLAKNGIYTTLWQEQSKAGSWQLGEQIL